MWHSQHLINSWDLGKIVFDVVERVVRTDFAWEITVLMSLSWLGFRLAKLLTFLRCLSDLLFVNGVLGSTSLDLRNVGRWGSGFVN